MSPAAAGIAGIVLLIILFMLRMPVAFAMALVGFGGFAYLTTWEAALSLLSRDFFDTFSSYPLSVIPMFVLMGTFAFASGISRRLSRWNRRQDSNHNSCAASDCILDSMGCKRRFC